MPDSSPFSAPPDELGSGGTGRGPGRRAMLITFLVVLAGALLMLAARSALRPPAPASGVPADAVASVDASLNAGETLRKAGDFAKAEKVLTTAIGQFPKEQVLYIAYAELLAEQKRPADAYAQYEKALAVGPRDGEIEITAGTLASMLGRLDRAEEHYAAAQAARPHDYKPSLLLAQVQVKRGETDEAKKNLMVAGNLKPDSAIVWGTLADLALRENKTGLARQHIARARQVEPRVTLWRLIEARALRRDNEPEQALELLTGLDPSAQREPGVMELMSECYGLLGRPGDAADLWARAADKDPTRGDWSYQAALWFDRAGDGARALEYAQRAVFLNVEDATPLYERLRAK